jgi:hypothetical protein
MGSKALDEEALAAARKLRDEGRRAYLCQYPGCSASPYIGAYFCGRHQRLQALLESGRSELVSMTLHLNVTRGAGGHRLQEALRLLLDDPELRVTKWVPHVGHSSGARLRLTPEGNVHPGVYAAHFSSRGTSGFVTVHAEV